MMQAITPTSKATLKMQCLFCCKGDIAEAEKLYDYFVKDMPDLPDYDVPQPTWVDNTKSTINGLMGWFKENQDTIASGYEMVRSIIQKKGLPVNDIAKAAGDALPNIN